MLSQKKEEILLKTAMCAAIAVLMWVPTLHSKSGGRCLEIHEARSTDLILAISATHFTPQEERSYNYLRIFSDSTIEWDSLKRDGPHTLHSGSKKKLPETEFNRVKSILNDPELLDLKNSYETRYAVIDSWTEWRIDFHCRGQSRSLDVLEFSPGLARAMKQPYPKALLGLGCTALQLRAEVSGDPIHPDSECKRYLGDLATLP